MISIYKLEVKNSLKTLAIWSLAVGLMGFFCIVLYASMKGDIENMAASFAQMGAFAEAMGLNKLSIATLNGYFATEIGTIHGLGSGLFAAIAATCILSKEEDGHTGEFLFSLPVSRGKVVMAKLVSVITNILVFNLVCMACYLGGFAVLGEEIALTEFFTFMGMQALMNVEIALICFAISAFCKKNALGVGLGVALICYIYDIIGRAVPTMKDQLVWGPYSYANAAEIFTKTEFSTVALVTGIVMIVICAGVAFWRYLSRDLAS